MAVKTAMDTPYGYTPTGKDTGVVKSKGKSNIPAHEGLRRSIFERENPRG